MQADPIKPTLKASGTKRLKLKHIKLLSSFAIKSNLRCYNLARRAQDASSSSSTAAAAAANPHDMQVTSLLSEVESEAASLGERKAEVAAAEAAFTVTQRADAAFGTRGIQSYLFESALGELSARVGAYMHDLTGGELTMELRPAAAGAAPVKKVKSTAPTKKAKTTAAAAAAAADEAGEDDEEEEEGDEDADAEEARDAAIAAGGGGGGGGGAPMRGRTKTVPAAVGPARYCSPRHRMSFTP